MEELRTSIRHRRRVRSGSKAIRCLGSRAALPQDIYGSARATALAQVGARYDRNALIFADLSNDTKYAEQLLETFGPRVIGVHISRHGNGMQVNGGPSAAAVYRFTMLAARICWKLCTAICK